MLGSRVALTALLLGMAWQPAAAQMPPARNQVQHLLRRFAFSAPPETVTAVIGTGIPAWLAAQVALPASIDCSAEIETPPTALASNGSYVDSNVFERMVMQHMAFTPCQLQAKMELHWLDHFAVGLQTVGDPALMYHYEHMIRANALGNFTTLMIAIAQEPAMLIWLNNNYNSGPVANENFAREAMQLYTMGLYKLNDDGSTVLDANKNPVATYGQPEVQELAKAMTGYYVNYDGGNGNPETRFSVQYNQYAHYAGVEILWQGAGGADGRLGDRVCDRPVVQAEFGGALHGNGAVAALRDGTSQCSLYRPRGRGVAKGGARAGPTGAGGHRHRQRS